MNTNFKWDINHLFNNGNFVNLPELVCRLDHHLGDKFGVLHEKKWRKEHGNSSLSDLDYLFDNYETFNSLTLNKKDPENLKLWFAESCFFYFLFYAHNLREERYATELSDLKSKIKLCVKIFIENGLKSLGHYSKFNPHPDYCINPPEKYGFFKESKKEYETFIENATCDDDHFEFVLYMFLKDFQNRTLPEENNFTKDYKSILFNISEWIGYSKNQEYYNSMVNNFIINYYFHHTAWDGNKPNFYEFGQSYESQMMTEKNHAYKGMMEIAFYNRTSLCRWFHYDSLLLGKNQRIEELAKWIFGEIFYTDDSSKRMKEIFASLMNSEDLFSMPGLILLLYLGIKRMNFDDFSTLFVSFDAKSEELTTKIFEKSVSDSSDNEIFKESYFYTLTASYIKSPKNECNLNKKKILQALFYFLIWDLSSKYQLGQEDTFDDGKYKINQLFDKKNVNDKCLSFSIGRESFMYNFYKPLEDDNWLEAKVIQNILNQLADFFEFKTENPFDSVDFSELKTGKINVLETLSTLIFNLAHDASNNDIKSQIDYIKYQQEHSVNCIPNFRKEYKNDAQRKIEKEKYIKNQTFLKKTDTGFELKNFEQSFYPFNYKIMSVYRQNTDHNSSYILEGYELKDDKKHYPLNRSSQYSLKRNCICKFIVESDTDLTVMNGSNCKLRIDSDKRFRSAYNNNFSHAYLNYHRNKETHNSCYTPIEMLLYGENQNKKYLLTALFDIKEQLSREIDKLSLNEVIQLYQLKYLKVQCEEIFKIIMNKYFPEIIDEDCWNVVIKNGELNINKDRIKEFNSTFSITDFDTETEKTIIDFFNVVWNVDFIFFDTRINNVSYTDMSFFKRYEIPIKFYEIYLSLAFQKFDGDN